MDINNTSPILKIYAIGFIWWIWFLTQPFDWDKSILIIFISAIFYILYFKLFTNNKSRLIYMLLTAPMLISISFIIVGTVWYLIAETIIGR